MHQNAVERQVGLFVSHPWVRGNETSPGVALDLDLLLGKLYPAWITLRMLAEKVEDKSKLLSRLSQDRGIGQDAAMNLSRAEGDHFLDKLVASDLFQGVEHPIGIEVAHPNVEVGIYYLLNQKVDSLATGELIAGYTMRKLSQAGRFDILGSERFQDSLNAFIGQYEDKGSQKKVRSAAVKPWFDQAAEFMGEHYQGKADGYAAGYVQMMKLFTYAAKLESHLATPSNLDFKDVRYPPTFFAWSQKRQSEWIDREPSRYAKAHMVQTNRYLNKIVHSPLVSGKRGLLRMRVPRGLDPQMWSDSSVQQGRMLLLSLTGLQPITVEKILTFVQLPPNSSRAYTGKLPAAMIARVSETAEHWHGSVKDKDDFVRRGLHLAYHNWPTPADGGGHASLPSKDFQNGVVYQAAVQVRVDYVRACIANGWELPSLRRYLPQEVLNNRVIMREFVTLRREKQPRRGWNAPLRRDPSEIAVYDSFKKQGEVEKSTELEITNQVQASELSREMQFIFKIAPSIGAVLIALLKPSKL